MSSVPVRGGLAIELSTPHSRINLCHPPWLEEGGWGSFTSVAHHETLLVQTRFWNFARLPKKKEVPSVPDVSGSLPSKINNSPAPDVVHAEETLFQTRIERATGSIRKGEVLRFPIGIFFSRVERGTREF